MANWPVSQRLFAVIALALVMGLVFGGLRVADAEGSAAQFGQVSRLANLGVQDTAAIQALQNERDATAGPLTSATSGTKSAASSASATRSLPGLFGATNAAAARVRQAAAGIGGAFPANIRTDVAAVLADISPGQLNALHHTLQSGEDAPAEIASYGRVISDMITLNDLISQGVSDSGLANDVRALNFLSLSKEQASHERALLYSLFFDPYFVSGDPSPQDSGELSALNLASAQESTSEAAFQTTATPAENSLFLTALSAPEIGTAGELEDFVFGNAPVEPATAPIVPNPLAVITALGFSLKQAPQEWFTAMSAKINAMRTVEAAIASNISERARALQQGAQRSALVNGIITAVVLLLVLGAALFVARSLVLPLRRLRIGALHIASAELPERVKQFSETPDATPNLDVAPIDVLTADEIGQVARAFDQVHAEAVRLAGNEAMLRASFNAVFVNLSRRSQSLIERLARNIESMEQDEDDPGRLANLFSMDHLVTRMRRNSENLLLLAGHEGARKWSDPVAVADVARAATSEIEQYGRVVLNIQPGVAVIGQAVSDVVHLLAELIENATLFSPKDTQVQVSAQELSSGGVLIEISDKGIGVSEARLADMNWRLDNTPEMDVSVSRHMGLFAVARLAERHQVRVRLRPANPQGLSALVWLPDSVIQRTPRGYVPPVGDWSKPWAVQPSLASRRSTGRQGIGTRTAVEGSRLSVLGAPADEPADDSQSTWFRNRRISATGVGTGNAVRSSSGTGAGGWQSSSQAWPDGTDPLTQGRHAARIIADPIRGDQTAAGLPQRVPQANLIPGAAGGVRYGGGATTAAQPQAGYQGDIHQAVGYGEPPSTPSLPQRSPELAHSRLSGFQRGARRALVEQQRAGEGVDR